MHVIVNLMAIFSKYLKENHNKIRLKKRATVRELVMKLGLPVKYVRIITVNGKQVDLEKALSNGDVIFIFPPAIGGG